MKMAQIIIDEYDDVTPYGITTNDACWGDPEIWCDKHDLIDLRDQINYILDESAE